MDAKRYLTCLWPGLSELWYRGRPSGLPAALTFAAVLNFLLIARFLYPEWPEPLLVKLACWATACVWGVSVFRAFGQLQGLIDPRTVCGRPDRFIEARQQYLRGHWIEAESLLTECLEIESRDPPALLLLAGVYRHTGRSEAAAAALDQLDRMDAAQPWWLERRAERARLARSLGVASETSAASGKDSAEPAEPTDEESTTAAPDERAAIDADASADAVPDGLVEPSDRVVAEATDQLIAAEMAAFRG